jgi:hypothetical protein
MKLGAHVRRAAGNAGAGRGVQRAKAHAVDAAAPALEQCSRAAARCGAPADAAMYNDVF